MLLEPSGGLVRHVGSGIPLMLDVARGSYGQLAQTYWMNVQLNFYEGLFALVF